jgi:hypothetical protein
MTVFFAMYRAFLRQGNRIYTQIIWPNRAYLEQKERNAGKEKWFCVQRLDAVALIFKKNTCISFLFLVQC